MDHGDPISYLVLNPGLDVISSDGERVGAVEHVLADERADIFDRIPRDSGLDVDRFLARRERLPDEPSS